MVFFGVCYGIYSAPDCIFHNQHKTLYNLFSPDPADSCVVDKLAGHRLYTRELLSLIYVP